jgi:hypothetical protein
VIASPLSVRPCEATMKFRVSDLNVDIPDEAGNEGPQKWPEDLAKKRKHRQEQTNKTHNPWCQCKGGTFYTKIGKDEAAELNGRIASAMAEVRRVASGPDEE